MTKEDLIKKLHPNSLQVPAFGSQQTQEPSEVEPIMTQAEVADSPTIQSKYIENNKGLSSKQKSAIKLIILGCNDQETARRVHVSRETVCNWRNHNPAFIAELNTQSQALWQANTNRLRLLMETAIEVLELDLVEDSERTCRQRAAVHILRSVGLYGKHLQPQGEIYPEAVAQALTKTCPTSLANQ